jgi:CHAT domain-containing protein
VREAHDLLVAPLALDASVRRLVVSPDGPLALVPFPLLDPGREVTGTPSGTVHVELVRGRVPAGEGVLAIGDPETGAVAAVAGGAPLPPLPAAREEARVVGDDVLLGADATKSRLVKVLQKRPRWRAVHFACHGLVHPDRPTLSALALAPDDASDGLLTGQDVFCGRFSADLVVLSACETARAEVVRGEGLVGWVRAFLFAGAPRVVCSLWKVDDEPTLALMRDLYARWKAGVPPARALQEAQATVRSDPRWRHPSNWAAWVLWGLPE